MKVDKHSSKIQIISPVTKENPFAIIYKPSGIQSAPLTENDRNCALYQAAEFFPEILKVKGKKEIEAGLIHRIDTVTDGLLLIASDQATYDFFIQLQKEGKFIKTYSAKCSLIKNLFELKTGYPENENAEKIEMLKSGQTLDIELSSYFRAFGPGRKEVRPVNKNASTAASKKSGDTLYTTSVNITKSADEYICKCRIENGFRHQVRSHLAWCKIPVKGDALYNPEYNEGEEFFFTATGLSFIHPLTKENISISID